MEFLQSLKYLFIKSILETTANACVTQALFWRFVLPKLLCHSDSSPCPLAHALDLIGDRWTLLIVRDLMFRNLHEYKDLLNSFEGISTNILADRLRRLVQAGLIKSVAHPESKTRKLYYLTPSGKSLIHVMIEIVKWSDEHVGTAKIPPDVAGQLEGNRDEFVRKVLEKLERWEAEHLA
jgi:DNA-binding HxlR family transcriptional regulator